MPNLVGTGLNQVPTNGMLGGLAYQDPDHASIKDLDLKNLSQINSEIADTAVDVFVYDTRKDSDGGAWRKKTQNTSWYNETLGTATRGTRKEFPAVAVIVAEYEKLTIYDGDDPDLPMWMIFNYGTNNGSLSGMAMLYSNGTAVSALNGIISSVGNAGWHDGLTEINFLADFSRFRNNSNVADWSGGIITRNTSGGYGGFYNTSSMYIISASVNDVAMTVLPNAQIDAATGLLIPTIALATAAGVSVIKDDGTVVDIASDGQTGGGVDELDFYNNSQLIVTWDSVGSGTRNTYSYNIPASDTTASASPIARYVDSTTASGTRLYFSTDAARALKTVGFKDKKNFVLVPNSFNPSIVIVDEDQTGNEGANGMIAYATTLYNTGYMHGAIKGAFLSSTDATNMTGGNLISNGDAWSGASSGATSSTPPTGWTGGNGAKFKINSGGDGAYLNLVNAGSAQGGPNSYMYQAITTVPGRKYKISVTQIHHATISVFFRAGTQATYSDLVQNSWNSSSGNTPRYEQSIFTATGTTTYITLGIVSGTNDYWVGWDDLVVTEVDEDRSANANGLHSFGTITKTAVATGAELVAYSGFSLTNYLRQFYNSDLDLGTGDFCVALWTKRSNESTQVILEKGNGASNRLYLYISSSNDIRFSCGNQGTSIYGSLSDTSWHQIVMVRRSGTVHGYVNGKATSVTGNAQTVTGSTDDELFIGKTVSSQYPYSGSIALVRISGSAPSAEQIKKMYEDEKYLFHENAKATLYGSSDAVTALAYDDTTNLLHVGTSAGRSEFQGLCRINNTTTAVTTAISASNGLIAEQ